MEHPGKNIALIHHGEDGDAHEHEFTIGYTQNTISDNSILDDTSNTITVRVVGNLITQNNMTVDSGGSYFGDGTTLTGVALETDLVSNVSRISVLETDLASNASRVGVLEIDVASNAARVGVLETDLASNAARIGVLELRDFDDAVNIGNVTSNTIQLINVDVGLVATGNVEAARFIGDGSYLTGLVTTLQDVANNGNTSSNTIQLTNADVGLVATGNIQANYFIGDGSQLTGLVTTLEDVVNNGNTSSNAVQLTNADVGLVATGNIQANYFIGDGSQLTGLVTTLEDVVNNGNTSSNTIQLTNTDVGLVATGNIQANYFIGDGSQLDNIASNLEEIVLNGNVTTQTIHIENVVSLTTTGNVGIGNTSPGHDLSVASNLYVDDVGSNVLVVSGNASFGHTITLGAGAVEITTAYNLEEVTGEGNVTSNVIQFTNSNVGAIVTGGLVVNDGSYACKHYAYSNVSVPTDFANVAMTFASNVFHAKITAQLTHGNEEVSTMVLDVQGGTRDGTTSSLDIATGVGSVFGNTNTKPWSGTVSTTPTKVILEPSATGTTAYGVDVYIEYKSSSSEGKLESISIGTDTVKSFVY